MAIKTIGQIQVADIHIDTLPPGAWLLIAGNHAYRNTGAGREYIFSPYEAEEIASEKPDMLANRKMRIFFSELKQLSETMGYNYIRVVSN